jgi:hemoglobin
MATLDDILSVLRRDAVAEQTQKDVLAIAYSLQGDILHG